MEMHKLMEQHLHHHPTNKDCWEYDPGWNDIRVGEPFGATVHQVKHHRVECFGNLFLMDSTAQKASSRAAGQVGGDAAGVDSAQVVALMNRLAELEKLVLSFPSTRALLTLEDNLGQLSNRVERLAGTFTDAATLVNNLTKEDAKFKENFNKLVSAMSLNRVLDVRSLELK
jgi:hypothetical protein